MCTDPRDITRDEVAAEITPENYQNILAGIERELEAEGAPSGAAQ